MLLSEVAVEEHASAFLRLSEVGEEFEAGAQPQALASHTHFVSRIPERKAELQGYLSEDFMR